MKIRNGFVSNSSSSSFLIYGITMGTDETDETDENSVYEMLGENVGKLSVHEPTCFDTIYVGRSLSEIGMDETRRQFQERTEKDIRAALGNLIDAKKTSEFGIYSKAWYDG